MQRFVLWTSCHRFVQFCVLGMVLMSVVLVYNGDTILQQPILGQKIFQENRLSDTVISSSKHKQIGRLPTAVTEIRKIQKQFRQVGLNGQRKVHHNASTQSLQVPVSHNRPTSVSNGSAVCKEKRHLFLVKIEKTGSGSLGSILIRFGEDRNLTFALPSKIKRYAHFLFKPLLPGMIIPVSKNSSIKYDILYRHTCYNKKTVDTAFPTDVAKLVLVREPYARFISYFEYFNIGVSARLKKKFPDPVEQIRVYLQNGVRNHRKRRFGKRQYNNASFRMGIPFGKTFDKSYVRQFIKSRLEEFDQVLLTEYFDESLVLMKRRLCWKMVDILYKPQHVQKNLTQKKKIYSDDLIRMHRKLAAEEYMIYDYMSVKFWNLVRSEGLGFWKEVRAFKMILKLAQAFCWNQTGTRSDSVVVDRQIWNETIILSAKLCQSMSVDIDEFTIRKQKEYIKIRERGA